VSEAFNRLLAEVRAYTLCEPHREAGGALSLGVKSNMTILLRMSWARGIRPVIGGPVNEK
jgi:hypothetical protein